MHTGLSVSLFAAFFIYHGLEKLTNISGSTSEMRVPVLLLMLVALAETLAGIGAFFDGISSFSKNDLVSRLSGLAPVLFGAIFMVHFPRFSFSPSEDYPIGGFEFQLLLLGVAFFLIITGNGKENQDY